MCHWWTKQVRTIVSLVVAAICCALIWIPDSSEAASDVIEFQQDRGSIYVGYNSSSGLPVILSAPHGGSSYPDSIPDRDAGCWNNDTQKCVWTHGCGMKNFTKCRAVTVDDFFTQKMTAELRARLCELFDGSCPAAVYNLLGRTKFDANRDREEATFVVPEVVDAFDYYHTLIEREIATMGGVGLFIDIHGHGHPVQRAELGFLVRGSTLDASDPIDPNITSIRSVAHSVPINFDELIRGNESFGGILGEFGFDSVPSPKYRGPGNLVYFNGGYNTRRHGSVERGRFDALQIESARSHREPEVRPRYVQALACTIKRFYCLYYSRHAPIKKITVRVQRSIDSCASYPDDVCRTNEASEAKYTKMALIRNTCLTAVIFFLYTSDYNTPSV